MEGFQLAVGGAVALCHGCPVNDGADGSVALRRVILQLRPEVVLHALLVCNGNCNGQGRHIKFIGTVGIQPRCHRRAAGRHVHRHCKARSGIGNSDLDYVILFRCDLLHTQVIRIGSHFTRDCVLHRGVMIVCPGRVITGVIVNLQGCFQLGLVREVNVDIHIVVLHDEVQIAVGIAAAVCVRRIGIKFNVHDIVAGIGIDPRTNTRSRRGGDRILIIVVKLSVALGGIVMEDDVRSVFLGRPLLELHCHSGVRIRHLKANGHTSGRTAGRNSHIVPGHRTTGGRDPPDRVARLRRNNNGHIFPVGNDLLHIAAVTERSSDLVSGFHNGGLTSVAHATGANGRKNQEIAILIVELHCNSHVIHGRYELTHNVLTVGICLPWQNRSIIGHSHNVRLVFRMRRQNCGEGGKDITCVSLQYIAVVGGHPIGTEGIAADIVGVRQLHLFLHTVRVNNLQPHFPLLGIALLKDYLYRNGTSGHSELHRIGSRGQDRCAGTRRRNDNAVHMVACIGVGQNLNGLVGNHPSGIGTVLIHTGIRFIAGAIGHDPQLGPVVGRTGVVIIRNHQLQTLRLRNGRRPLSQNHENLNVLLGLGHLDSHNAAVSIVIAVAARLTVQAVRILACLAGDDDITDVIAGLNRDPALELLPVTVEDHAALLGLPGGIRHSIHIAVGGDHIIAVIQSLEHHGGFVALPQHRMEAKVGLGHGDHLKGIGGLPRNRSGPGGFGHRHAQLGRRDGGRVQIIAGIGHHSELQSLHPRLHRKGVSIGIKDRIALYRD